MKVNDDTMKKVRLINLLKIAVENQMMRVNELNQNW
jgi:hypothetical protein